MNPRWRAEAALIALGVGVRVPALRAPRVADDWYHLSMVEGTYPLTRSLTGLYDFLRDDVAEHAAVLERGTFPWWTGAHLRLSPWRPITSAFLWLDHALWGRGTVGPHVLSLAWWSALLVVAALWFREVLPRRAALLALALLALDESVTAPVAWIANRGALIAGALGLLGAWLLARHRVAPSWGARAAVTASFTASVLAGEYGVAVGLCAIVFECFVSERSLRDRAIAVAPALLPCMLYVAAWKAMGYGVRGTMSYLDPLSQTGEWLAAARGRLPALSGELVLTWPVSVPMSAGLVLVAVVLIVVVAAAVGYAEPARRRVALAAMAATVAALVPELSAPPMGRLLLPVAPAFSMALAAIAWCAWQPAEGAGRWRAWALRGLVAMWAVLHLVASPLRAWTELNAVAASGQHHIAWRSLPGVDTCHARDQDHVLLAAQSFESVHTAALLWMDRGCTQPRTWRILSAPEGDAIVLRTGERSLVMQSHAGRLFAGFAWLWRPEGLREGDWVALPNFTAEVMADVAATPTRIAYTFDRALDDPRVVLWIPVGNGYEQMRAPALHGGRVVLANAR